MGPPFLRHLALALAAASAGCADIDSSWSSAASGTTTDRTGSGGASTAGSGGSTGTGGTPSSTSSGSGGTGGDTTSSSGSGGSGGFTTVFTIVLENHDYNEIVDSPNAPYINFLIDQYGLATNYFDCGTHPSLPNYLYLISGDTQYPGGVNVNPIHPPYFPSPADNLGSQMQLAGIPWRSYQESMGTACKLFGAGLYAPRHDPFLYFDNIQNGANDLCAQTNVDYSQFSADLAAGTYRYMWITPNLLSDGHDPVKDPVKALHYSDIWLSMELPKILTSDAYKSGGVVFLTWDEAEGRNGNDLHQVPMIVISPKLKSAGMKVDTLLTHAAYLATVEEIFGLPKLGAAAASPTLLEFFQ